MNDDKTDITHAGPLFDANTHKQLDIADLASQSNSADGVKDKIAKKTGKAWVEKHVIVIGL